MAIIQLSGVRIGYGGKPVLDSVDMVVEPGERIALVGRNGEGKSTLMKVLGGELEPAQGTVRRDRGTLIARLPQEVPQDIHGSVFDVVSAGLGSVGDLLARYHHLTVDLATATGAAAERMLGQLDTLGSELEACDGWNSNQRIEGLLTRMELDPEAEVSALSGGMKRRVLLARALAAGPSLLLLDEPTNHLDIAAIEWLERFLSGFGGALLVVTHDRAFLRKLATRVLELDRGRLTSWPGAYDHYLTGKTQQLEAEATENALFDKKLAQEEVWIRRGIKARRTRNEGRVRALEKMREERSRRRDRIGTVRMALDAGERSGKLVIEAKNASFAYQPGGPEVVRGLTTTILRGDRVGIIGPNGAGKSTLLNLLLGKAAPTSGSLRLGAAVQVAYFDQLRATLNDNDTVVRAITEGGAEELSINGRNRHVMSYLQDFLFTPERARQRVEKLSGGERNRLLLAKLFARPANLLVMDEPTNDLDVETLDLLEELLTEYPGTLLLVSHDRDFLDNVVTSTLVFEGDGVFAEYVGGYSDWQLQRQQATTALRTPDAAPAAAPEAVPTAPPASVSPKSPKAPATGKPTGKPAEKPAASKPAPTDKKPAAAKRKLSFKEQQELAELPGRIEKLESEIQQLGAELANPEVYKDAPRAAAAAARVKAAETELETAFARWQALDPD